MVMLHNEWALIECLADDPATAPTVISAAGHPREWTSVRRLAPAPELRPDLLTAQARTAAAPVEQTVSDTSKGPYLMKALPVLGPAGDPHGIQLWIGDPDIAVPPPRLAAGVTWNLDELLVHQTRESSQMSGHPPEAFSNTRTAAEFTGKAIRFDTAEDMIAVAIDPQPGRTFSAEYSVLHDDGHIMAWQVALRSWTIPGKRGFRALNEDLTDVRTPQLPSLSDMGLADSLAGMGRAAAVIALSIASRNGGPPQAGLAKWIGTAPDWVGYKWPALESILFHPEDQPVLDAFRRRLHEDSSPAHHLVRLPCPDGNWQTVNMIIRPFPGRLDLCTAEFWRQPG